MLFETPPPNFNPDYLEVVGALVEFRRRILLVLAASHKPHAGRWGLPSGKVHAGESLVEAARRETAEETGLLLPGEPALLRADFVVYPNNQHFKYTLFRSKLSPDDPNSALATGGLPEVILSHEHTEALWIPPRLALRLNLIEDLGTLIKSAYPKECED